MICFIGFLIVIGLLFFMKICDNKDWIMLGGISLILIIIIIALSICFSGFYIVNRFQYESEVFSLQQTRAVYVDELNKYEQMRNEDCFGSPVYLELKEKIIEFNRNIYTSNRINNFLFDYSIINPAYREIEPIPLSVG